MENLSKKQRIEATAKELFWKHGVKRVSIGEICEKAGVSRKTFYAYYANKNELALFLLNGLFETSFTYFREEVFHAEISMVEKIERALNYKLKMAKTWSKEFFVDIIEIPELRDYYKEMTQQSLDLNRQFIVSWQQSGEINRELSVDYILLVLKKYSEWIFDPQFIDFFPDVETLTKQLGHSFIYGIMPVPKSTHNE